MTRWLCERGHVTDADEAPRRCTTRVAVPIPGFNHSTFGRCGAPITGWWAPIGERTLPPGHVESDGQVWRLWDERDDVDVRRAFHRIKQVTLVPVEGDPEGGPR